MYSIVLIIGTVIFSIIVSLIFYTKKTDKVISLLTEILIELGLIDNQKEISSPFNVHHKVSRIICFILFNSHIFLGSCKPQL